MPEVAERNAAEPTPPKRMKLDDADDGASVVTWEVEDPSEFRPEKLGDMGKEKGEFRLFYNVSSSQNIL